MRSLFFLIFFCPLISGYGTFKLGHGVEKQECDNAKKELCGEKSKFYTETKSNCLQEQIQLVKDEKCKESLKRDRKEWQKKKESFLIFAKTCKPDIEKHCKDEKGSRKNLTVCLMMNSTHLSKSCKEGFNRHASEHLPGIKQLD